MKNLKIRVVYFLNEKGLTYFPAWFDEVLTASAKQDGFISLQYELEEAHPVMTLCFESLEKLDLWRKQDLHTELLAKISGYWVNSPKVDVEENSPDCMLHCANSGTKQEWK